MLVSSMKHCDRAAAKKKVEKEIEKANLGREAEEVKNARQIAEESGLIKSDEKKNENQENLNVKSNEKEGEGQPEGQDENKVEDQKEGSELSEEKKQE